MRPPNSAWLELEGMPSSQVSRFQMIAPVSPAKTIAGVTSESSTMPEEIVLATSVDMNAPTTLRTAASATATRGRSAPVATEVAIALALSWNPLVKSKARAVITTMATMTSEEVSTLSPESGGCEIARRHSRTPRAPAGRRRSRSTPRWGTGSWPPGERTVN